VEAVKGFRIPVDAPKDLIDSYFEAKRRALEAVLNHVKFNRKTHLDALWLNYFNGYFSPLFHFWKFFSHIERG